MFLFTGTGSIRIRMSGRCLFASSPFVVLHFKVEIILSDALQALLSFGGGEVYMQKGPIMIMILIIMIIIIIMIVIMLIIIVISLLAIIILAVLILSISVITNNK